ncbi:MAG TPA: hypothetical protein VF994_04725 [Myxococcales bacterium]
MKRFLLTLTFITYLAADIDIVQGKHDIRSALAWRPTRTPGRLR